MIENIRALVIFAETIRQGSFRGAASRLKMSPSSISHNVSTLEKRLGTALIYRSTRKLTPTGAGTQLFRHALIVLESAERGMNEAMSHDNTLRGRLHITMPAGLIGSKLNQRVAEFCKLHPKLRIQITYSDARQDLISNAIDLAIRAGEMPDSGLVSKRLGEIKRLLVCAPSLLQARPKPNKPVDLKAWPWINLDMMPEEKKFIYFDGKISNISSKGFIKLNNINAAVEMCVSGVGLATPPDYLLRGLLKSKQLVNLLPDWSVEPIPVHAVWPANAVPNTNTSALVSYLKSKK